MFKILKNLIKPVATLEDILIKAAKENLELVLKVQIEQNVYQYIPLNNKDICYVKKQIGEYFDKDFYYYVIERCLILEQI